jgi:magnesium-transporting ATPase (P-type)
MHQVTSAQLVMGFDEIKQSNRAYFSSMTNERTLSVSLLGRGDLIRLTAGCLVAADGIFISSKDALLESIRDNPMDTFQRSKVSLKSLFSSISRFTSSCVGIDESMLTGESLAVRKRDGDVIYGIPDLKNCYGMIILTFIIFLCLRYTGGTMVVEGSGYLLVTATGSESMLGRIVNSVQGTALFCFFKKKIFIILSKSVIILFVIFRGTKLSPGDTRSRRSNRQSICSSGYSNFCNNVYYMVRGSKFRVCRERMDEN